MSFHIPEFWLDEMNCRVIQVNNLTRVEYYFHSLNDAKRGYDILVNYIDKRSRKRRREPLYPENLANLCISKGIPIKSVIPM